MSQTPDRVDDLFAAARELPPAEREAFVRGECGPDAATCEEVLQLLLERDQLRSFLETPLPARVTTPDRIGRYRVLETLGQGGMGVVYRAEQTEPVQRTVAVKVMRAGLTDEIAHARFRQEIQLLASLSHRGIAKVHDAGKTDDGCPFYVMEFVGGQPIVEFCDEHELGFDARLDLFIDVCEAVQHAHRHGVIHRDLKPWNILVASDDGHASPKIIDFGIARDTGADPSTSMLTKPGQFVGTLSYASPEQLDPDATVDTRSDVYALGVLLFELLTGCLPFDGDQDPVRLRRQIMLETPAAPSSRAPVGGATPGRRLRGDVDRIVLRALETDRDRRYASPLDLARDITRSRNHEPIEAGPPSAVYRMSRFVRRHRIALAIVLMVVIGGIAAAWGVANLKAAERRVEMVSQIAENVIASRDPRSGALADLGVDSPLLEARLRARLGSQLRSVGMLESAGPHLERALELREAELGPSHVATLASGFDMAELEVDRGDLAKAERRHLDVLARRRDQLGALHPDTLNSEDSVASVWSLQGRVAEATGAYERVLAARRETLGPADPATLSTLNNLALAYMHGSRGELAEEMLAGAVRDCRTVLGDEAPQTLETVHNLGMYYMNTGRPELARERFEQALRGYDRVFGPDYEETIGTRLHLAQALDGLGKRERAVVIYESALNAADRSLRRNAPIRLMIVSDLARIYEAGGELDRAETMLIDALSQSRTRYGGDSHRHTITYMNNLGSLYKDQARYAEGERQYAEALKNAGPALGEDDVLVGALNYGYGICLRGLERYTEAVAPLERSVRIFSLTFGPDSPNTKGAAAALESVRRASSDGN